MARTRDNFNSGYTLPNKVKLVRGGHLYFEALERMIDEAKYTLHFQTYIFDADETGIGIAQALLRAARRQVKVFLLIDGFASQHFPGSLITELRSAGVYFRWFGPILKNRYLYFGRRLHHKVIVADGVQCLVGGLNISNRYNDRPEAPAWLDWALLVEGEIALRAFDVCARRAKSRWIPWRRKVTPRPPVMPLPASTIRVRLRTNDWVMSRREITKSYSQMLRQATSEVIIMSSYFMPGSEFRRNLRLAAKRGVKIQLILAGVSDIHLAKQAERYSYAWLLRHKIEIFEYTKTVLHGKMAYCDGKWVTVGSYNLNDLSAKASIEMNLDVMDEPFARETRKVLKDIIKSDCIQITEDEEKRTGLFGRIIQRSAYTIFRALLFVFTFYFRQHKS